MGARRFVAAVLLSVALARYAASQAAPTQPQQRQTSKPYSGDLSIFEYPDRDKKLQIDRVMDLLDITAGKNVADIGAGSGWFAVRASKRVGATGAVLAEDINPLAIEYIGKRVVKENIANVRTVLGQPDDPMLPTGSVNAVLLLKVYHEIAHPVEFMKKLKPALREGAKVGIIDKNGNGANHGLDHGIVEKEMGDAGFKLVSTYDFTKADGQDYFMIFVAK
jgi:ubiquinone/menaquinone biosynthesis C-methylase UbiE